MAGGRSRAKVFFGGIESYRLLAIKILSRSRVTRSMNVWPRPAGAFRRRRRSTSTRAPGLQRVSIPPTPVPADYVLFVNRQAIGVIEAKPKDWGHKITTV